jgi:hypothetical protein
MSDGFLGMLRSLDAANWFVNSGNPFRCQENARQVRGWSEAFDWTEHPVSQWCNVEATKALFEQLSSKHYDQFRNWNKIARRLLTEVSDLIKRKASSSLAELRAPSKATDWLQGVIMGAAMEHEYHAIVNVELFRPQMKFIQKGHFPCGWTVNEPADFPQSSVILFF